MYNENYDAYKAELARYKANKADDHDHDPAASQLQQDFAGAEESSDDSSSSDEDDEDESSEDEKPPSPIQPPSSSKRRRSEGKATKTVAESPQKKGKAAKNAEPPSAPKVETKPEPKRKGKKRKSEA